MQNATKSLKRPSKRREADVQDLLYALKDAVLGLRRMGPDDHRDKAAIGLLAHLTQLGPVRVSDLADIACLSPSTVSRHLTELEEAGHVTRIADENDKRAVLLQVTPSGTALVDETRAHRIRALTTALDSWSAADINTMSVLIRRLASDLENR